MTKKLPTIVFFGSGPVAAKSLELLLTVVDVEAIITKPSTLAEMSAVVPKALSFAVSSQSELDTLLAQTHFKSSLGILIDFGIIVSQAAISAFSEGIINSHFSILPEWRGADPISLAILSGQTQTGVSIMKVVPELDEGPLLGYGEYDITHPMTTPELTQQLILLSQALLEHDIPRYLDDKKPGAPQSITGRKVSYSRKLTKADGVLDATKPAVQLEREIRAFIEWPRSHTQLAGKDVIITKASVDPRAQGTVGQSYKTDDKKIGIYTSEGSLIIEQLQPAGKSAMSAAAFLAGYGSKL